MKKNIEFNPFHTLILIVAYIADIVIFFTTDWPGITFGYVIMLLIVILPPLGLAVYLLIKLYYNLAGKIVETNQEDSKKSVLC